jgi:hypothetical protein
MTVEENELNTLEMEESDTLQQLQQARSGEAPINAGEAVPLTPEDVTGVEAAAEIPEEDKITIGDKEFATQEEAMAYAKDLHDKGETEKLLHDAYRQGIQDAAITAVPGEGVTQEPVVEEEDDFDQKFFENPKEYLKSMAEKVRQETKAEIQAETAQKAADQELWGKFYGKHPDLVGFEEDCQIILAREAEMIKTLVKTSGEAKAMDYLARKTRAKFQSYAERQRPQQELPANQAGATPTGGERVTQGGAEKEEGPVDFVGQMRQHKKVLENRS